MISIRKYLDVVEPAEPRPGHGEPRPGDGKDVTAAALSGYAAALHEMGQCGADVCPALGQELKERLGKVAEDLRQAQSPESVVVANESVRTELEDWGRGTARHYQKKACEVKDILIVMARTAESVGERDQRCAQQMNAVTTQLRSIANLEDLTQIRASVEKSAAELKSSIERMTAEGRAALEQLRTEVSTYQAKFEEAEQIALRDALTHLGSRLWVEGQMESRIKAATPFCVAILDIDGFKRVNDEHGHVVGDELLPQFSTELRSACRSTDVIGRWGGDEFIVVLDCGLAEAEAQIERVSKWVCGNYSVAGRAGGIKLRIDASMGVAEQTPGGTIDELIDRADREMYRRKSQLQDNPCSTPPQRRRL
jgi:diguanylate cyclase (GGDEF)-like protein